MSSVDIWKADTAWAAAYAAQGKNTHADAVLLLRVLGFGQAHANGGPPSPSPTAVSSTTGVTPTASPGVGLARVVPLATYLLAVDGQHADLMVPSLMECLRSLEVGSGAFSLTKSAHKRGVLLAEVLGVLAELLELPSLPLAHKEQLSSHTQRLLRECLEQMAGQQQQQTLGQHRGSRTGGNGSTTNGPTTSAPPAATARGAALAASAAAAGVGGGSGVALSPVQLDPDFLEAARMLALDCIAGRQSLGMPLLPHHAFALLDWWAMGVQRGQRSLRAGTCDAAELAWVAFLVGGLRSSAKRKGGASVKRDNDTAMAMARHITSALKADLQPLLGMSARGYQPMEAAGAAAAASGAKQQQQSGTPAPCEVPHAEFVGAAAALLARLCTVKVGEGALEAQGDAQDSAADLLLHALEAYLAAVEQGGWGASSGDNAGAGGSAGVALSYDDALAGALALFRHVSSTLLALVERGHDSSLRLTKRLDSAMATAAVLYGAAVRSARSPQHKLRAWQWDLSAADLASGTTPEGDRLQLLARGLVDALSHVLAASWKAGSSTLVTSAFIPLLDEEEIRLSMGPQEQQAGLLVMGRLAHLTHGDDRLCSVELQYVLDSVGSCALPHDAEVYGVMMHALAHMVVAVAQHVQRAQQRGAGSSNGGGGGIPPLAGYNGSSSSKALGLFASLYKAPDQPAAKLLLEEEGGSAVPSALRVIAVGLQNCPLAVRASLRQTLLGLFCDVALGLPPAPSVALLHRLGSLLPALAAACDDLPLEAARQGPGGGGGPAGGGGEAVDDGMLPDSLEAVQQLMERDAAIIRLYRLFWLTVSIHDLGGMGGSGVATEGSASATYSYPWPSEWRDALGVIASRSPPLVVGGAGLSAAHAARELDERLEYDLHEPLQRLGARASPTSLMRGLQKLLAPACGAPKSAGRCTPARLAYVLSVAHLHVCRAELAELGDEGEMKPLAALFAQLQVLSPEGAHYPFMQAVVRATFNKYTARWQTTPTGAGSGSGLATQVQLACVLIDNLSCKSGNAQVPRLAAELLGQHLRRVEALMFERPVVEELMRVLRLEEEKVDFYPSLLIDGKLPAAEWLGRFVRDAVKVAPRYTDMMLQQLMLEVHTEDPGECEAAAAAGRSSSRRSSTAGGGGGGEDPAYGCEPLMAKHTELMLHTLARAHEEAGRGGKQGGGALGSNSSGATSGISSVALRAAYTGRVSGLADMLESQGRPRDSLVGEALTRLRATLHPGGQEHQLEHRFLELAAALSMFPSAPASGDALHWVAATPAHAFDPRLMQRAVYAWTWIMAAASKPMQIALLAEIANAWVVTVDTQRGLFDRTFDPVLYEQSTGGQPDLLAPGHDALGRRHSHVQQLAAHHSWLNFLQEMWQLFSCNKGSDSVAALRVFGHMLQESLRDPDRLSYHPASAGCRFLLLRLALQYCGVWASSATAEPPRMAASSPVPRLAPQHSLLYKRAQRAALMWFSVPVTWYGRWGAHRAGQEAAAVCCFRDEAKRSKWRLSEELSLGGGKGGSGWAAGGRGRSAVTMPLGSTAPPRHPVWGQGQAKDGERQALLQLLLGVEVDRLSVWAEPRGVPPVSEQLPRPDAWAMHIRTAWDVSPRIALGLKARFPTVDAIQAELRSLLVQHAHQPWLQEDPEAAVHLANALGQQAEGNAPQLRYLSLWAPLPLLQALSLISGTAGNNLTVREYALRSMRSVVPEQVAFFLPQLVQLLRKDGGGLIAGFLVDRAKHSTVFAQQVLSLLASEARPPEEAFNPTVKRSGWQPPSDTGLWQIAGEVQERVWREVPPAIREHLQAEQAFFEQVTSISGKLYPVHKDQRKAEAVALASTITVPRQDLFIPTNPHCNVRAIIPSSATPMRSAAKVPILVAFKVVEQALPGETTEEGEGGLVVQGPSGEAGADAVSRSGEQHQQQQQQAGGSRLRVAVEKVEKVQACIFKVGDDIRQDVLALQVIGLLKDAFVKAGLDLVLFPYGALPTGYEQGIIEVVPNSHSRAEYGEIADGGLYEIFQRLFGSPGTQRFERARANFLKSEAGYAIASFILLAKDRHGGNLMINSDGFLVHIDFGFILGISPGGNLGFESAAFKLSHEMTQLIDPGGKQQSAFYHQFVDMCVRGFLAARSISSGIMASVSMMQDSGLPCFGYGQPISALASRFHLEMTDAQAAAFMRATVADSYNKWTTGCYDWIQYQQQRIPK